MRPGTQRFVLPLGFVLLGGCGPSVESGAMCKSDGLTRLVELDEGPSALANMWGVRDDLTDLRIYDPATGREEVVAEGVDREFARWNHGGLATQHSLGPHDYLDPLWPARSSDTLRTGVVGGDDILFAQTFEDRPIVWRLTP